MLGRYYISFIFFSQTSSNCSIMDQLSRGVKVEGLTLPPGITLTRVDPTTAEGIRAKKEAISRVSSPHKLTTSSTIVEEPQLLFVQMLIQILCSVSAFPSSANAMSAAVGLPTASSVHECCKCDPNNNVCSLYYFLIGFLVFISVMYSMGKSDQMD